MDIKNEVLVWVEEQVPSREGPRRLRGLSFDDSGFGLGTDRSREFRGQLTAVSPHSRKEFPASISVEHHQRNGFLYCIDCDVSFEMPCVLSSCRLACIFDGFIELEKVNDESFKPNEVFETPLPLVGDNWLGVAWSEDNNYRLVAFSEENVSFDSLQRAYCPWWADGFNDTNCIILFVKARPHMEDRGAKL